ncbi:MAG: hypothetical protein COC10_12835 [Sphingobium sp.]|nr:MAG: hypothetical protein COC10_12835 [Sphingobium sp.]
MNPCVGEERVSGEFEIFHRFARLRQSPGAIRFQTGAFEISDRISFYKALADLIVWRVQYLV